MTDPMSAPHSKPAPPKKGVSPARNAIGVVALIVAGGIAWFEYSAKIGYNSAASALDKRTQDEHNGFLTPQEAETLMGKLPDDAGSDVQVNNMTFTKKSYTWKGLFKSYTLTAFYTKNQDARLHHFQTSGAQFTPEEGNAEVNFVPPKDQSPTGPIVAPDEKKESRKPVEPVEKKEMTKPVEPVEKKDSTKAG